MYEQILKLRTEAYTFTLGLLTDSLNYSPTDSLIFPHNALENLAEGGKIILWPNSYKGQGSGSKSLEATT